MAFSSLYEVVAERPDSPEFHIHHFLLTDLENTSFSQSCVLVFKTQNEYAW